MTEAPAESVVKVGLPSDVKDGKAAKRPPVQQVHHMFRTFAQMGTGIGGSMPGDVVDAEVNNWLANGWRIHSVHHVVNVPEGHTFCWVLIRDI